MTTATSSGCCLPEQAAPPFSSPPHSLIFLSHRAAAALFPVKAKQYGAKLAIVNRDPTPVDDIADLVLHEEIGLTLTAAMRDLN